MTYMQVPDGEHEGRIIPLGKIMLLVFASWVAVGLLLYGATVAWGQTCPTTVNAPCVSPNLDGAGCCPSGELRCLSGRCRPALHSGLYSPCYIGAYGWCVPYQNLACARDRYCRKVRF